MVLSYLNIDHFECKFYITNLRVSVELFSINYRTVSVPKPRRKKNSCKNKTYEVYPYV